MKGLKDYVLNDDNWNPGRQGNERGRKIGRLELLDRLLATAGWYVFDMCAGPQILVFLLFLLLLNAAELIRNPLRNVWIAYLAIMCAQLVNAFLRRTYFTHLKLANSTNDELIHLSWHPQILMLSLNRSEQITAGGLAHLKGLVQLQTLDLSSCKLITDGGLAHLKGLVQLQTLDLSSCELITYAALAQLQGLVQLPNSFLRYESGIFSRIIVREQFHVAKPRCPIS